MQSRDNTTFEPPEDWHEPREVAARDPYDFRIVEQTAGAGYRHILSADDVRQRLRQLPASFIAPLETVQLSRMTRKKESFACYGMQWGSCLYLYPMEEALDEWYSKPPKPNQVNEAEMYGGRWIQEEPELWRLRWSEDAIRDFYLNNILIHELGHLLDERNTSYYDRERYAEWFAVEYGYRRSKRLAKDAKYRPVTVRHGKK
ncbi:MAG: hypothetical protein WD030_09225 [Pirellulales bacterium]